MVIPTVRIVIHDDKSGAPPFRVGLEKVDQPHHQVLLVQRIGITGMTVLIRLGLQEANGGEISCSNRGKKILQVVLVVGRSTVANFRN